MGIRNCSETNKQISSCINLDAGLGYNKYRSGVITTYSFTLGTGMVTI